MNKSAEQREGFILIYSGVRIHSYLQAVNVQQVQFSFVRLFQDVVLLNCHQMLLHVTFNCIEASETVQFIQKQETPQNLPRKHISKPYTMCNHKTSPVLQQ